MRWAILWLLMSVSMAAKPAHVPPSETEWAEVVEGKAVTRGAPDLSPPGAYGWVEIEATPDQIWAVLNNPSVAVEASGAVTSCDKYLDEPTATGRRIALHYVLNVAWTEVSYHVMRDFRPGEGVMTWRLDDTKDNDLVSSSGHYVLLPGKTAGHTLLVYQSQADSGRRIPQWIQQSLSQRSLRKYLSFVRDAAEAK